MLQAVFSTLTALLMALAALTPAQTNGQARPEAKPASKPARDSVSRIVEQIKPADYEGDRVALKRFHGELTPLPDNRMLASRGLYWRGFALWRRAINGFNESPSPKDLAEDLNGAITDFNDSLTHDPAFVESKIGEASCFGHLAYLSMKDPARMQDMIQHSSSFLKDAMASDPDNPRLLWVLGPIRWSSPPERGGGQDKAFDLYQRGLEAVRTRPAVSDPLEPSWGEPELHESRLVESPPHNSRLRARHSSAAKFKMRRASRADCPGRRRGFLFLSASLCENAFNLRGISANRSPALE